MQGVSISKLEAKERFRLPPTLMAAFSAVANKSGASSPPWIARISLGTVKNNDIPAAAEKAT